MRKFHHLMIARIEPAENRSPQRHVTRPVGENIVVASHGLRHFHGREFAVVVLLQDGEVRRYRFQSGRRWPISFAASPWHGAQ